MKDTDKYVIENLLPIYFDGKATEEEACFVESWIAESAENSRMARHIYMLCLAADVEYLSDTVNVGLAWQKMKKRMKRQRSVHFISWIQRVAAVLFIPLFISCFVLYDWLEKGQKIHLIEVKANQGMTTSLVLPDSTVVYLNSGSKLIYPSSFMGNQRNVSLEGEAYFEVAKDEQKHFIVSAPHGTQIEVIGTHFDVEAYADRTEVYTTLLEGKVCFMYNVGTAVKKLMMKPGYKLKYNAEQQTLLLTGTSGRSEIAWTEGKIVFENTPLEECLRILEKYYAVDFLIKNPHLKENSFTTSFERQRLDEVLEYFYMSSGIRWRYIGDRASSRDKIELY